MKIRIKIIEKNNGTKTFIPQVREGFLITNILLNILCIVLFGRYFSRWCGLIRIKDETDILVSFGSKRGEITTCHENSSDKFNNYESAANLLKEYIHQKACSKLLEEKEIKEKKAEEIKSITYVKL